MDRRLVRPPARRRGGRRRTARTAADRAAPSSARPVDGGRHGAAGAGPRPLARSPELLRQHDIEVLSTTPELRGVLGASRETLTSPAVPTERTRFYARVRTQRLSHGLVELLRDHLRATGGGGGTLGVESADQADPTGLELFAVLLRRLDPRLLTLVVCTFGHEVPAELAAALAAYAERRQAPDISRTPAEYDDPAAEFVAGDCLSDDPALVAAYAALDEPSRRLHREQAARPAAAGEQTRRWPSTRPRSGSARRSRRRITTGPAC